jgi:hypothetical protein
MTLKNIFIEKDFKIKNRKRLHASFQNNLPMTVYDDLYNYVNNMKNKGLILR